MSAKRAFFGIFQKIMVVCCAIFFGFANAFSANLPSGYTELEYIQSTGTQYIDTGVILDKLASEVFINFKKTNDSDNVSLMGCQDSSAGYNLRQTYFYASGALRFYNSTSTSYSNLGVLANNVKHTIHTIVDNNNNVTLNVDGVTKTFTQQSGMSDNRLKLYLFANNSNGSAIQKVSAQMYSVWIRNSSGTLVFNGIPAKNSSGVIGMYDTVSGNFFTNKGTGTFTAGPVVGIRIATTAYNTAQFNPVVTDLNTTIATIRDIVTNTINQTKAIADLQAKKQTRPDEQCPAGKKCLLVEDNNGKPHWYEIIENICGVPSGYTCLDYIQSSGTQYIDPNINITSANISTLKTEAIISNVSPGSGSISGYSNGSGGRLWYGLSAVSPYNFYYSNGKTEAKFSQTGSVQFYKYIIDAPSGSYKVYTESNDLIASKTGLTYSTTHDYKFYLFTYYPERSTAFQPQKIKHVRFWFNNALVRDMVPAKNSSGVIGMYDLVNDVFYTNQGTGTFTAGPEI